MLERLLQNGVEMIVFDAAEDEDMEKIASLYDSGKKILWVGSAGLADCLPKKLRLPVQERAPFSLPATNKSVLLVAGSVSKVTREQVAEYIQQANVTAVELNPQLAVAEKKTWELEAKRCQTEILHALSQGQDVAFYSGASQEQIAAAIRAGHENGLDSSQVSNRIADALGAVAASIVDSNQNLLQGFILTGGDTAKAVCKHLGVSGLQLLKEMEPGVPVSRLVGSNGLLAVTKAGAFGTKKTLVNALRALKGDH
jgi:uncharacterized protein YgbK (DUF1537 family)